MKHEKCNKNIYGLIPVSERKGCNKASFRESRAVMLFKTSELNAYLESLNLNDVPEPFAASCFRK